MHELRRQAKLPPYDSVRGVFWEGADLYPGAGIEVDGGYHSERTQQEDDAVRQEWLESVGYKVIRFSNEAILVDIKTTIDTIINNLSNP